MLTAPRSGGLEPREINDGFNKDGIITHVGVLGFHDGHWAEEGAATGDVHLCDRALEGRGCHIRAEGIDDVLPVILVQKHQGDLWGKVKT